MGVCTLPFVPKVNNRGTTILGDIHSWTRNRPFWPHCSQRQCFCVAWIDPGFGLVLNPFGFKSYAPPSPPNPPPPPLPDAHGPALTHHCHPPPPPPKALSWCVCRGPKRYQYMGAAALPHFLIADYFACGCFLTFCCARRLSTWKAICCFRPSDCSAHVPHISVVTLHAHCMGIARPPPSNPQCSVPLPEGLGKQAREIRYHPPPPDRGDMLRGDPVVRQLVAGVLECKLCKCPFPVAESAGAV